MNNELLGLDVYLPENLTKKEFKEKFRLAEALYRAVKGSK